VQCASTSDNEVEGSSEGGVPRASPSDNEVEGSSEGGVPSASPSDDMNVDIVRFPQTSNLDEGSHVLLDSKGKLYRATIRKLRVKSGKQEFLIHYDGNKTSTPSIPPARRNPDCAVRSARGVSVALLRTSDEPTDVVVDPSSSDNIFEPTSDNESTEDVFSLSAYEQVESEVNDSYEDNEDDESNEDNDDEDHEDNEDDEDHDEEMTNESDVNDAAFNDANNDSDAPVAAELGPNDIMIGVHHSKLSSHPGNMRATELALLNYKEYSGMNSRLEKRALAAKLIKHLDNEGRRFLIKTSNGWMTMSDEQTHFKFLRMMTALNKERGGHVKVKPAKSAVKYRKWNDDDCKTLRKYITENDVDDMFMWGRIAKKLNRSEMACKQKTRMILDCGIYDKEKEGDLIVYLSCFNF
jgi:hypothetical protein